MDVAEALTASKEDNEPFALNFVSIVVEFHQSAQNQCSLQYFLLSTRIQKLKGKLEVYIWNFSFHPYFKSFECITWNFKTLIVLFRGRGIYLEKIKLYFKTQMMFTLRGSKTRIKKIM